MNWVWFSAAVLICCSHKTSVQGKCKSQSTCSACVSTAGCAWCKQRDFLMPGEATNHRCNTKDNLRRSNCLEVINPKPRTLTVRDKPFWSDPGRVVQLRPQKLHIKLRLGVPHTFNVMFKRAEGSPIDLYYLMDLSFSMRDDLDTVRKLGHQIVSALKNVSSSVRIGLGGFVEKATDPFINTIEAVKNRPCNKGYTGPCQPSFSFKHVLPLTEDVTEFTRKAEKESISSNKDNPEAGFDAIMQVAVCQDQIGWGDVTRILVYTSDGVYHLAGDGKLGGIYYPNDGKCHLNSEGFYDMATYFDYPSIAHVAEALSNNHIKLIFAVTKEHLEQYTAVSELIPQSVVGVLEKDSSNVVQLISKAYHDLSSTILLEHHRVPPGIDVSYVSQCSDGTHSQNQKRGACSHTMINDQVNFTVTLTSSACLHEPTSFILKVQGLNEELQVTVETLCNCDCNDTEPFSPQCKGKGTLTCGICSCDEGNMGQSCECEMQEHKDTMFALDEKCVSPNSSQPCSGQGSCLCGMCICRGNIRGKYCQCDDTSCNRHNNIICGGNGKCNCGTCECNPNYSGHACECSTLTDQCYTGGDGLCSHNGHCECNKCQCHPDFFGRHCSEIRAPCIKFKPCVLCAIANGEDCKHACGGIKLVTKMNESGPLVCFDEKVNYNVEMDMADGSIRILYVLKPSKMYVIYRLIGTASGGVVVIGLIGIMICKILLEII
ncbi:integrin beta-7-like isoform X1 [Alosa alosa]|uniref:integrin beta-7-like isoform X1 n=2 Tax=Alosa alosa TaxID=278164 RepID=UPI002015038E|nr:integrin beta-7-like isoform X1 [Alosa alosa]